MGLGIDVVEVARIDRAMRRRRFLDRILTPTERAEPLTPDRVAGRWAAKEAVAKAVGASLTWQDVEIKNMPNGLPIVLFSERRPLSHGHTVHLSISHARGTAVAVAILERLDGEKAP